MSFDSYKSKHIFLFAFVTEYDCVKLDFRAKEFIYLLQMRRYDRIIMMPSYYRVLFIYSEF